MKREKILWPLTHGHQHALSAAKALRERLEGLGRTGEAQMKDLRLQAKEFFDLELMGHFKAEEDLLDLLSEAFPSGDRDLVRLKGDHRAMEQLVGKGFREDLLRFSDLLVKHVRFEEEVLFGRIEKALSDEDKGKVSGLLQKAAPPKVCPRLLAPGKE